MVEKSLGEGSRDMNLLTCSKSAQSEPMHTVKNRKFILTYIWVISDAMLS